MPNYLGWFPLSCHNFQNAAMQFIELQPDNEMTDRSFTTDNSMYFIC